MQKINPWRRIAITVTAMLVVLLLAAGFRFVQARGLFASVENKTPAVCRTLDGVSNVTAITSNRQGVFVAARGGAIFGYADGKLTKFSGTPKDFHPVAISAAGAKLFAVFARADASYAIAVFTVEPGKLSEIGRLTTDLLTDPADLVTVDGERFYLVNKHASRTAFGRWIDDAFLVPRAEVLYFDGMKFVPVAKRLNAPAGTALSPDGAHLYVAQELPRSIASFSRNEYMGSLDDSALLGLSAAPTKISVAPDGSLIVAAWPKRGQGAVYRVRLDNGVPQSAELLYGSKTETVTAAAEARGHLLVGSDKRLLDCTL